MILQIISIFLILLGVFILGFHLGQNSMLKLFRETMSPYEQIDFVKRLQERLILIEKEEK